MYCCCQHAPYAYVNDGKFTGFIPDLLELLSHNLNFEYE